MEIRILRYFLEVAREENITRSATHLHISQPTLSRQLKDLEDELGKKLFVRSNYSVRLTEEGMLLRKRAEDILDMVDKTTDEFKSLNEINGGDIHIGCAESDGIKYFFRATANLRKEYPHIRYHLYSSGTDAVNERLDRGLLMRKDSSLSAKASIKLSDLKDIPLICSRQSLASEMPAWFGDDLAKMNILATYDLLFNASVMVREGFGYALGFDKLIYTGIDSDLCFRPLVPELISPMYVIWKKYQVFTPVAALLVNELKKIIQHSWGNLNVVFCNIKKELSVRR